MQMQNLTFLEIILVVLILAGYFLPSFIAMLRDHKNKLAIVLLNTFLGWTLLGWISSLVWSVMK